MAVAQHLRLCGIALLLRGILSNIQVYLSYIFCLRIMLYYLKTKVSLYVMESKTKHVTHSHGATSQDQTRDGKSWGHRSWEVSRHEYIDNNLAMTSY